MEIRKKDKMWFDDGKHTGVRRRTTQSSQGTSYRNDLRDAILPSYYGTEFEAVKNSGSLTQLSNALEGQTIRGKKADAELVKPENLKQAFSVVDNGFTPMSIMGKEWDRQWAIHNERRLINKGGYQSPVLQTEMKWIARANAEQSVSVKEFYDLLVADRITKNPSLLKNLVTKKELEAAGYTVSDLATPFYRGNKATGDYYDMSAIVSQGADDYFYNSPVYADEKLFEGNENLDERIEETLPTTSFFDWAEAHEKTGISYDDYVKEFGAKNAPKARVDIHTMGLTAASSDAEFKKFIKNLEDATGARIEAANLSDGVKVYAKRNILRTAGRRVVNYYRVKFNKRSNLLRESYTISYDKNASREEQIYALLSQVAELSTKPFINNTEKLINNGKGYNLPTSAEFSEMKETLGKFTTAMTTAEIAKIVMFNANDAAKIEGLAYLKASQTLAAKPNLAENRNLISLASGYTAAAINRCAAAMGITLEEYESVTGKKPFSRDHNNTFLAAVFAKQKYSDFSFPQLYKPTGFAKTQKTQEDLDEQITEQFKYLADAYNKAENDAELENNLAQFFNWAEVHEKSGVSFEKYAATLAEKKRNLIYSKSKNPASEDLKTFFDWAVVNEKSGISFEDYAKGVAAKNQKTINKAINSLSVSDAQMAKVTNMFVNWTKAHEETGISFGDWFKEQNFVEEVVTERPVEKPQLRETKDQVKQQLWSMFGMNADAEEEIVEEEVAAETQTTEETAEEVIQGFRKRVRDWALYLKIFKGKAEKTTGYQRDVTGLGKTSSVRSVVYREAFKVFDGMSEKGLTADQKELFNDRNKVFPTGDFVTENDLKKAQKLDASLATDIESVVNEKVEEILTEAANDEACKTMTGTKVAEKHFANAEVAKSFAQKVKEKIFAPVVKAPNQTQQTLC